MQKLFVTQCPSCFTRFQLTHEQLTTADGIVRCGECEAVFAATRHLETAPRKLKVIADNEIPDTIRTQLHNVGREPVLLMPLPQPRPLWSRLFWGSAVLVSFSAACAQLVWFERDRLASDPRLTPLVQHLCTEIDCRLSPPQDLSALISHQLLVRDHPQYDNALSIDLLLENRADFEQPFPALKLVFRTRQGQASAARIFEPSDYLGGEFSANALMPRNKTIQLHLALEQPTQISPAYELDLIAAQHHLRP